MTTTVQSFVCSRCDRGEFRSLPGSDGKAFCPWCGDAVSGGAVPPPPPAPDVADPEIPAATASLEQLVDRVARNAPEDAVRALRDRVADLNRTCERATAELRQELDKKDRIKKVVMEEVGRLGSQMSETKVLLRRKEEDHLTAVKEMGRLKEDLEKERQKAAEETEKKVRKLESELEERRKEVRDLLEAGDVARRDAEQIGARFEKAKASAAAELAELRKKLAAAEARLGALKDVDDLRARVRSLEKERAESQGKSSILRAEVEKRDQRVRELQLLIKTLGERLNDLTSRRL